MPKFLIILWDRIDVGTYETQADAEAEIERRLAEPDRGSPGNPYTIREIPDSEFNECAICGGHATSPKVDFCRTCYQTGQQAEREFAGLLAELGKLDNVEPHPHIWNSGGGCFILEINLKDGRCIWATDAFEIDGKWEIESGVPDTPEGPWSVCVAASPEVLHEGDGDTGLTTFIPVLTADFPAVVAAL